MGVGTRQVGNYLRIQPIGVLNFEIKSANIKVVQLRPTTKQVR